MAILISTSTFNAYGETCDLRRNAKARAKPSFRSQIRKKLFQGHSVSGNVN